MTLDHDAIPGSVNNDQRLAFAQWARGPLGQFSSDVPNVS
jgi:hypothetical protein